MFKQRTLVWDFVSIYAPSHPIFHFVDKIVLVFSWNKNFSPHYMS